MIVFNPLNPELVAIPSRTIEIFRKLVKSSIKIKSTEQII